MKHKGLLVTAIVCVLIVGAFFFGLFAYLLVRGPSDENGPFAIGGRVGLITIDGTIISANDIVRDIEGFRKNNDIKSVIMRLESPGGSVGASQEILEAVKRLAEKKPVVASMGSVAASGAYYIACGATRILASPGTITGSIGVRLEHLMVGDLLSWAKVKHETLKSGHFKDLGSIDRPMTPEERAILQGLLDDMHKQFKEEIVKARGLEAEKVDSLADGRVYTGRQALELGLVDAIGGLSEAVVLAGNLGGIKGEPKLVRPQKRLKLIDRFFEAAGSALEKGKITASGYWQPVFMMGVR